VRREVQYFWLHGRWAYKSRGWVARHTFATAALMAGVNPAYVAKQLGHTNAKLLFETYAKWIDGADKHQERDRMEAAFGGIYPQNSPKKSSDACK